MNKPVDYPHENTNFNKHTQKLQLTNWIAPDSVVLGLVEIVSARAERPLPPQLPCGNHDFIKIIILIINLQLCASIMPNFNYSNSNYMKTNYHFNYFINQRPL